MQAHHAICRPDQLSGACAQQTNAEVNNEVESNLVYGELQIVKAKIKLIPPKKR